MDGTHPSTRAREIFEHAFDLGSAEERAAYLEEACGADAALLKRVQALIQANDLADSFLSDQSERGGTTATVMEGPGTVIDRYKLFEKIGEGGMGVVYMAEQEEPVRRRVALKIIKLGMDTRQVVARFEAERQALAMMDHPNIARVLDGGATDSLVVAGVPPASEGGISPPESASRGLSAPSVCPSVSPGWKPGSLAGGTPAATLTAGRPYFVMELVQGVPITEFCEKNHLSVEERIKLFIPVCQAIQSAHQKGIIHRDIKPSNVLVTLHDGVPVPKVIDFGVAKAINQKLTEKTLFTNFGTMMGTPAYMSPEQAEMSGLDIDTRSDIYSLGVLLYELLTGTPPFPEQRLRSVAFAEMQRIIMQEEPERPSTRLKRTSATADPTKSQIANRKSKIENDLDWIVMKCLEKDRARRYQTANGLATDLKRHLSNEPVTARPPSATYRLQKAWRRNKLVCTAGVAVFVALVAGLALAALGWLQARVEREETRRRAYVGEINAAFQALEDNNLRRALELLNRQRPTSGEEDLRGFEWRHLWKLCQPDEKATFRDQGALCAAFSPDGRRLAYGADRIVIRELPSHSLITNIPKVAVTLAFSPSGKLLASGHDSQVTLWNCDSWQEERSMADARAPAVFSPDGQWLVTGTSGGYRDGQWHTNEGDGGYLVWSTETWERKGFCAGAPTWQWREQAYQSLAFSPDGKLLFTAGHPGGRRVAQFQVWDFPSLTVRTNFEFLPFKLASAVFTPDGKHLLTGGWYNELLVWDVAMGRVVDSLEGHTGRISDIAYTTNGGTFATASSDRTLIVWAAATRKPLVRLRGHLEELRPVAMSPDGRTLASGSLDGTTKLWDAATRHERRQLPGFAMITGFSADSRLLVLRGSKAHHQVWNLADDAMRGIPLDSSTFRGLDTYADVRGVEPYAVFGKTNGTVEFWNLGTMSRVKSWRVSETGVAVAALSPDVRFIATTDEERKMKLWELATARQVRGFSPLKGKMHFLTFSPNGRLLAGLARGSRYVYIWDVDTGRLLRELDTRSEWVGTLAFSPDSKLLANACQNNTQLWEIPSGKLRATLKGHIDAVTGVAFSPDGKTLATSGDDRRVKLWNLATKQEVATSELLIGGCRALQFSPDGRTLAVGQSLEMELYIWLWQVPSFEEIAAAEAKEKAEINQP